MTADLLALNLCRAVRNRRKQLGLRQRQLAERLGVCRETISRLEAGEGIERLVFLCELAEALETTPARLFEKALTMSDRDGYRRRLRCASGAGSACR